MLSPSIDKLFDDWKITQSESLIKWSGLLASSHLQLERKVFRLEQLGKWVPPMLLIPVLFLSLLFAADHSLHEQLHKDASQPSHQCAITILEQQQLVASDPIPIDIESYFGLVSLIGVAEFTCFSDHTCRFSASRAPPVLLSPLV